MTNSHSDTDELKTLQREAEELRVKGKRSRSTAKKERGTEEEKETTKPSTQDAAGEAAKNESDKSVSDLTGKIGSVVKEMEEAASERPLLALLAAFGLGIIVGQLFSRR